MICSHFHSPVIHIAALAATFTLTGSAGADRPPTVIERSATPKYDFSPEDEKFLDDVERGCFNYLWNVCGKPSGLAKDRVRNPLASVAGVGFQLSALPIAVERGWITREEGQSRAIQILRTLTQENTRHAGVLLHFVDADTGRLSRRIGNNEASTVDHALFLAGAMTAASYFGGETAEMVDQMSRETNWKAFAVSPEGFLSMAWRPADNADMSGPGRFIEATWNTASDEERLIYFLAVGAPTADFSVEPRDYFRLTRNVESYQDGPQFVTSVNGPLFTYFFSHCWINFRDLATDDPGRFDVEAPRVDWFENSRRATLTHRRRCEERASEFATLGLNRWGLSPCMAFDAARRMTYIVQDVEPNRNNQDNWQLGTVAPYAAASAVMFTPQESLAALRDFRDLKDAEGRALVWRDPAKGGYAFADSFNLDQMLACDDNVAIDVGPMLLAIENARTGLVWRLFMEHEGAKRAISRLRLATRNAED